MEPRDSAALFYRHASAKRWGGSERLAPDGAFDDGKGRQSLACAEKSEQPHRGRILTWNTSVVWCNPSHPMKKRILFLALTAVTVATLLGGCIGWYDHDRDHHHDDYDHHDDRH
jgi:hypothetical protein